MLTDGKVWGQTTLVYKDGLISVHLLKINAGGFCSEHRHQVKSNIFIVLKGRIRVKVWRDSRLIDTTILTEGQEFHVTPGQWHQFEAVETSEVLEIYRARLSEPDIERRTEGGKRK